MIQKELEEAINAQINQEFTASYSYLGMSTYFDELSLDGLASWMQNQHSEEQAHAMRLLNYLKSHLQWFLDEQVEEEKSMEDIIANLKLIGDDKAGLLYLNDKLGQRKAEEDE